jgi:hypothetical protein
MSTVSSDIFKFMSLRPPKNYDFHKDVVNIIRDNRIVDKYSPDEKHDPADDEQHQKFKQSEVADYLFQKVKDSLPKVTSIKDAKKYNDSIVEDFRSKYGVIERLDESYPYIVEFVKIIKKHSLIFVKSELIKDLDNVVVNSKLDRSGILDYVELIHDVDLSKFCYDYYALFDKLYQLYVCKRLYPINLEYVIDGLRALHVILWLVLDLKTASTSGDTTTDPDRTRCAKKILQDYVGPDPIAINADNLQILLNATPSIHQLFGFMVNHYLPFNDIKPIGIGDLMVVKQFLCKYEAGEIAHVENVLKGESKDRSHRRLDRSEDVLSSFNEKVEETEKDLQSSERYELNKESENTIQTNLEANATGSVSGKYGVVEYSVNTGLSYSSSSTDSRKSTNNFAKDVVDRSLSKIKKTVREERTTKKIAEIEEINKHALENSKGEKHITGIYRWLDKHYKAQVYNYGKRLMFEFIIPEPAAFIMAAFEYNKNKENEPNEPTKPVRPSIKISEISDTTVELYSHSYDLSGVDPEPDDEIDATENFTMSGEKEVQGSYEKKVPIPEGYTATEISFEGQYKGWSKAPDAVNPDHGITLICAGKNMSFKESTSPPKVYEPVSGQLSFEPVTGPLNIAMHAYKVNSFAINLVVHCLLPSVEKKKWQLKTYDRIMDAYSKLLSEYNAKLSEYEEKRRGIEVSKGIVIQGRNTKINLEMIKRELKKHCVTMITKQFDVDKSDDEDFNAMQSRIVTTHIGSVGESTAKDPNSMMSTTLFTMNASDKVIESPNYEIAGYVYIDQVTGTIPLYRLSRQPADTIDLFYTTDASERASALGTLKYKDEGKVYVYKEQLAGTVPLYRLSREGQHFYTTSASQRDRIVVDLKYNYERIEGYISANPILDITLPAINIEETKAEGRIIQFLEQAFEWPQITYILYPYFWGKLPDKWLDAQKYLSEEDAVFGQFLQAGAARVLVAVHPAYEVAVLHYLYTREPWNGGPAPGIDDPLYIPIYEELRSQQDDLNGAKPHGDSWEVIVPTSLVYLQESSELPTYDCSPPAVSGGKSARVILEKIYIVDDMDPFPKGSGEIDLEIQVNSEDYEGSVKRTHLPKHGHYKIKSGEMVDINEIIFENVVKDHMAIRIDATEKDSTDPDDNLGSYTRIFKGDPNAWAGKYTPDDEIVDPENLRFWKVFYRVELT